AAEVVVVPDRSLGRRPAKMVGIVNAALYRQEGAALAGQFHTGAHAVVTNELEDDPSQRLPFLAAVADADAVEQVTQTHDPQTDAAGVQSRLAQLRHSRHISVGGDDVIK